ncbi:MAG: hypothetical protein WAV67_16185, partial [Dokdonella sp.]
MQPVAEENFWRQRGWVAWRAFDLDSAINHLSRSDVLIVAHPAEFSALRKAETQMLLADVELARNNPDAAQAHLLVGQPVFEHEYAEDHPERAPLHVQLARLALLQQRPDAALHEADAALRILDKHRDFPAADRLASLWIRAESLFALDDCAAALFTASRARSLSIQDPQAESLPRDLKRAAISELA